MYWRVTWTIYFLIIWIIQKMLLQCFQYLASELQCKVYFIIFLCAVYMLAFIQTYPWTIGVRMFIFSITTFIFCVSRLVPNSYPIRDFDNSRMENNIHSIQNVTVLCDNVKFEASSHGTEIWWLHSQRKPPVQFTCICIVLYTVTNVATSNPVLKYLCHTFYTAMFLDFRYNSLWFNIGGNL
jgi:hypothetical protein